MENSIGSVVIEILSLLDCVNTRTDLLPSLFLLYSCPNNLTYWINSQSRPKSVSDKLIYYPFKLNILNIKSIEIHSGKAAIVFIFLNSIYES